MALQQLRQLVPPPAAPVDNGSPEGWAQVEAEMGTRLPSDYKQAINLYGYGEFGGFFALYSPFCRWGRGNLLFELQDTIELYNDLRDTSPEMDHPTYPEPGGVLPLGTTTNGDNLFWVTEGDPDDWTVLLAEIGVFEEVQPYTVTDLIIRALAGQVTSSILPTDIGEGPRMFEQYKEPTPS